MQSHDRYSRGKSLIRETTKYFKMNFSVEVLFELSGILKNFWYIEFDKRIYILFISLFYWTDKFLNETFGLKEFFQTDLVFTNFLVFAKISENFLSWAKWATISRMIFAGVLISKLRKWPRIQKWLFLKLKQARLIYSTWW